MLKNIAFVVLFLLASVTVKGQSEPIQHILGRNLLSLNGSWQYIIDPYEMGFYDYRHEPFENSASGKGGFYDDRKQRDKTELIEYSFDDSPSLQVPGDWNSQAEKLALYEGTVWYRKKFSVHLTPGNKYLLYFGAANYEAHVYLNGKKLGMHKGGFTPFQFEVGSQLVDGENSLVVKVDNNRAQDEIPTINTDWWNYGGLTRDVYLATLPAGYIQDYKIQLAPGSGNRLEGYIQLADSIVNEVVTLSIPEAGIQLALKTDPQGRASFSHPLKKIHYWTPDMPKLYDVQIKTAEEELRDRIGFRTIVTKGQDILLNGQSLFLRGVSIHDENPLIPGRLRSEGDMRMLLQWAKDMGCNYVRLAHYPHNEKMIRLADEMGLLVWAEIPVYWTISWENVATYQNAAKQLSDLVSRDKNRASVIIWSVGNETPLSGARYNFMSSLAKLARSKDNSRLISAALEVHRDGYKVIVNDSLGELLDVVSFNEYGGWYWGGVPEELRKYQVEIAYDKPVVISEFGGDALAGFHGDEHTRWSEEYQESLYIHQLDFLSGIKGLRGMTPWVLVDFRSPRRQHPYFQDFWNRKGLYASSGEKKKAFYILKAYYDRIRKKYH
ncbi:glycoside hydrolase family 2 protein [Olivibacter sp. XZL3]|uniref:glycoside hydrolase family 2 protein n=1 Tax=Olivibacter sp. XZL3 TaxID=1735116 RepID=UPI001066DB3A|nr:glycoside hydrolase family 2 TIM barrel-domain containing protein [Olivibacter sp. XZL3]